MTTRPGKGQSASAGKKIRAALEVVRGAKDSVAADMEPWMYRLFLEALMADAEGWKVELADNEDKVDEEDD